MYYVGLTPLNRENRLLLPIVATDFPICDRPQLSHPGRQGGSLKVLIAPLSHSYNQCDCPHGPARGIYSEF